MTRDWAVGTMEVMKKFSSWRAGQAVVLALLLMAVVLTLGLAVISQSIVDVRTSTQSQEVVSAYSAAEAGIEQALSQSLATGNVVSLPSGTVGRAKFTASTSLLGGGYTFVLPRVMVSGDSQTLWFVAHDSSGLLVCDASHACFHWGSSLANLGAVVYWGDPSTADVPALLLDIYYKRTVPVTAGYSDVSVYRAALDPNASGHGNNFTTGMTRGSYSLSGTSGVFSYSYNLSSAFSAIQTNAPGVIQQNGGLLMIRTRLLYGTNPQPVGFDLTAANSSGSSALPGQGFVPESQGSVGTSATIRLISTYPYPDHPAIFDYAIFSGSGDINK